MEYSEKAIKILGDSLVKHTTVIREMQKSILENKNSITTNKNIKSNESKQLQKDIDAKLLKIDVEVQKYLESLPEPKNGKDAEVDYGKIQKIITAQVLEKEPQKVDYEKVDLKIEEKTSKIKQQLLGIKPKEVDYNVVNKEIKKQVSKIEPEKISYSKINKDIMSNFPKNEIVEAVEKRKPKVKEPVGIEDIKFEKDKLIIKTTDGKVRTFKISQTQISMFGGSGEVVKADLLELVLRVTESRELENVSQTILCDATDGEINIKLPDPSRSYLNPRSIKIAISKIDISTNRVNILPFNGEKILNDTNQYLVASEVINLVTDGIDWWYGA